MQVSRERPILVIEDGDEDFEMLRMAMGRLEVAHPLLRCSTGEEAMAIIESPAGPASERPVFVLLDLSLPGADGLDLLATMRAQARWATMPVVVFSTSHSPRDIDRCYAAGANAYAIKPLGLDRFEEVVGKIIGFWLGCAALPGG